MLIHRTNLARYDIRLRHNTTDNTCCGYNGTLGYFNKCIAARGKTRSNPRIMSKRINLCSFSFDSKEEQVFYFYNSSGNQITSTGQNAWFVWFFTVISLFNCDNKEILILILILIACVSLMWDIIINFWRIKIWVYFISPIIKFDLDRRTNNGDLLSDRKKKQNKKHSENADTSTYVTFDLELWPWP